MKVSKRMVKVLVFLMIVLLIGIIILGVHKDMPFQDRPTAGEVFIKKEFLGEVEGSQPELEGWLYETKHVRIRFKRSPRKRSLEIYPEDFQSPGRM
jgi:hypothetical protein